jgi:sugar O-acyltransferase (sialic acid O-acetyltransferase NeuD family)
MSDLLYVIGAGGHAKSVAEIASALGLNFQGFIAPGSTIKSLMGVPVMPEIPSYSPPNRLTFAIAIGDNHRRELMFQEMRERFPVENFPVLIHPSASVASSARVGFGSTVHQNASVGSDTDVGRFCILNTGSIADHDCKLYDFSSLGPGANVGGAVTLGMRSVVAIGSTVRHGLTVGSDSILGAASYSNENIDSNTVSFGSPARKVRSRNVGDPYL